VRTAGDFHPPGGSLLDLGGRLGGSLEPGDQPAIATQRDLVLFARVVQPVGQGVDRRVGVEVQQPHRQLGVFYLGHATQADQRRLQDRGSFIADRMCPPGHEPAA